MEPHGFERQTRHFPSCDLRSTLEALKAIKGDCRDYSRNCLNWKTESLKIRWPLSLSHIQDMLTTAKYPVKQDNFYLKVQLTFIPAFSHWGCRSTHLFLHFFKFTVHLCHFAYYFLERLFRSIWRWNNIRTFSQSETKSHFTKWKKS